MKSFPYNAQIEGYDEEGMPIFDRAIDASEQRRWTSIFYTNGVLADNGSVRNFAVSAGSGMKVTVSAGVCNINGVIGFEEESRELILQAAENLDRIDRVVLRLNDLDRTLDLYISKGTASSLPQPPALIRPQQGESGDIVELCLAEIYVPKGSAQVTGERITDTRLNTDLCGIITNALDNLNTNSYYQRFEATLAAQKKEFTNWFDTVRNILGEDEAGTLLKIIGGINDQYEIIVPTTGWTKNTEGMYELTLTNLNSVEYKKRPIWFLLDKGTSADAIAAEEKAFSCINRMYFGNGTIKLLCAKEFPTTEITVVVVVSGVELSSNSSDLPGVLSYEGLTNKPQINSVELSGNKSVEELGIEELSEEELDMLLIEQSEVKDEAAV